MDKRTRWLTGLAGLAHLVMGIAGTIEKNQTFLPASWAIVRLAMPAELDWVYPSMYSVAGILSIIGVLCNPKVAAIGLNISALSFSIWGCISSYGFLTARGGTIPGTIEQFLLASAEFLLAHSIIKNISSEASTDARIVRLETIEEVDERVE